MFNSVLTEPLAIDQLQLQVLLAYWLQLWGSAPGKLLFSVSSYFSSCQGSSLPWDLSYLMDFHYIHFFSLVVKMKGKASKLFTYRMKTRSLIWLYLFCLLFKKNIFLLFHKIYSAIVICELSKFMINTILLLN